MVRVGGGGEGGALFYAIFGIGEFRGHNIGFKSKTPVI